MTTVKTFVPTPISETKVGDVVRIDQTYYAGERRYVGQVGRVVQAANNSHTRKLIRELDGQERIYTYATEVSKVVESEVPTTGPATLDEAKVAAVRTAREVLGTSSPMESLLRMADYLLASTPAAPVGDVHVHAAPVPTRDLAADRSFFYSGVYVDGISISRDTANDDDLVYVAGGHLTISGAKEAIAYLQAAVNVGEQEGTGPVPQPVAPF